MRGLFVNLACLAAVFIWHATTKISRRPSSPGRRRLPIVRGHTGRYGRRQTEFSGRRRSLDAEVLGPARRRSPPRRPLSTPRTTRRRPCRHSPSPRWRTRRWADEFTNAGTPSDDGRRSDRRSARGAVTHRCVQHHRLGGARQRSADPVLRQSDLAGKQLSLPNHQPGRRARHRTVHSGDGGRTRT